jgi:hypothetical protein
VICAARDELAALSMLRLRDRLDDLGRRALALPQCSFASLAKEQTYDEPMNANKSATELTIPILLSKTCSQTFAGRYVSTSMPNAMTCSPTSIPIVRPMLPEFPILHELPYHLILSVLTAMHFLLEEI